MKILIVDDNPDDRRLLRYNIEHHGHEAIEAEDGQDGLEKAALHKPDLIISDAMMPRMDGFHFLKNLKGDENLRSTPFVFYSASYTGNREIELGLSLGAEEYIIKPREPEELWGKLNAIIERRTEGAERADVKEIKGGEEFLESYSRIVSAKLEEKVKELEAEIAVRKQTETALRVITGSASDAIICINTTDAIYLWNRKAEDMFGYAAEEAIGKGLHELIVPERYREKAYKGLEQFFRTGEGSVVGKMVELTALKKDGTEFPVELSISAMKVNNEWHATGIIRDITERKKAEQDSARLVAILEATTDFVGFADSRDTHISYINPAGRRMVGIGADEDVTKLKIADVHPAWTNKLLAEVVLPTATRDGVWSGECAFLNRDGREIPVLMVLLSHKDASGRVDIFSTISRDITEKKMVEDKLLEQLDELKRWQKATVGREIRMHEIIEENNKLKARIEEIEDAGSKGTGGV